MDLGANLVFLFYLLGLVTRRFILNYNIFIYFIVAAYSTVIVVVCKLICDKTHWERMNEWIINVSMSTVQGWIQIYSSSVPTKCFISNFILFTLTLNVKGKARENSGWLAADFLLYHVWSMDHLHKFVRCEVGESVRKSHWDWVC